MMMAKNIRNARKRIGFTQEELAAQIGVTAQAVSRWESEAGLPDIALIVPLAQVLRVSTDTLFGMNQVEQEQTLYMEIKTAYEKIESEEKNPANAARQECDYLLKRLESNPVDFVLETCFVERVANLSRYVDFEGYLRNGDQKDEKGNWETYRKKAIQCATHVIRLCQEKEWVERAHFALAWVYIHDKDFASAKEHIATLPSVQSNRLQESILAQIADFEGGVEAMKEVVRGNLQNFTRVINKEILYAMQSLAWEDDPETAIAFGTWGIRVMEILSERQEMVPYCRGFFRDIYQYILKCDLRAEKYEEASKHWKELKKGMQHHFEYYQAVLSDEQKMRQFSERQLRNMRAYTQEFIDKKQEEILTKLRQWEGENRFGNFWNLVEK